MANQFERKVKAEEFQVWKLERYSPGNGALLSCEDGDSNIVYQKEIEFTDFPLPSVELWCEYDGQNRVILLPSEH